MPPKRKAASLDDDEPAPTASSSTAPPAAKRGRRGAGDEAPDPLDSDKGWKEINEVLTYMPEGAKGGEKILGFDIDDTIIATKSGKSFSTNCNDWIFWHESVPKILQDYHNKGYKIVFFSNQAGIQKGKTTAAAFKSKLNRVLAQIPIPVQIYAATCEGKYRKPATGMWGMFVSGGNQGVKPNLKDCIYVGDAAGRQKGWAPNRKRDFSDSDRKFAINLEIGFQTPEEFFLGEKPVPFVLEGVDPKTIKKEGPLFEPEDAKLIAGHQEMVIMVGYPGSGKSYFSVNQLEKQGGYTRVNRDTLKTKEKCWKAAEAALDEGKSVVIDNTNPDMAARKPYIEMCKARKIPVRAFVMQTTFDEATHNNYFREIITNGEQPHVPSLVFHKFKKEFQQPTAKEGFSEVIKTYFRPRFDNAFTEKIFYQWTPL